MMLVNISLNCGEAPQGGGGVCFLMPLLTICQFFFMVVVSYPLANEVTKGYSNATFRNILVNTLESTSFNGFSPNLAYT